QHIALSLLNISTHLYKTVLPTMRRRMAVWVKRPALHPCRSLGEGRQTVTRVSLHPQGVATDKLMICRTHCSRLHCSTIG
ncbi:hypothetical protein, partial [Legionella sp. 29fVS95]|uniref:hypothetical protein n=1 Tax=Legionella sp. 29fVS95 TaxID=3402813 RepID=UPI003AF78074